MNTIGFLETDEERIGIMDRPYPVGQEEEEEEEEEAIQAADLPDDPVEVEPEPDTADPALEDAYTLVTIG